MASAKAQMFAHRQLSYGLFHAQVRPNQLYGIGPNGITFQRPNVDLGHMRHIRWMKPDGPQAASNDKPPGDSKQ